MGRSLSVVEDDASSSSSSSVIEFDIGSFQIPSELGEWNEEPPYPQSAYSTKHEVNTGPVLGLRPWPIRQRMIDVNEL
jgi:hypothetical protein